MSDNPESNAPQAPEANNEELSQVEQEQISGGITFDSIPTETTDDKHKGWIEIL